MSVRVALVVGSVLFTINHGPAVLQGKMTKGRWISAVLTYCVPYAVSTHGQYIAQRRRMELVTMTAQGAITDKELLRKSLR